MQQPPLLHPVLKNFFDSGSLPADEQEFLAGLSCTPSECEEFERLTRKQSECPEWHKLRACRLTASKFKQICSRRKDFVTLGQRLLSSRNIQTKAMREGIIKEPVAAEEYAQKKRVNAYPIGFVISSSAPHIGCSPDRVVYDPSAPEDEKWGLLEVKCPSKDTYQEVSCLKQRLGGGEFHLKRTHDYFFQIMGQLAITGFKWCDLFVWCENDNFTQRINFEPAFFDDMKSKLDTFYSEHYLKLLLKRSAVTI